MPRPTPDLTQFSRIPTKGRVIGITMQCDFRYSGVVAAGTSSLVLPAWMTASGLAGDVSRLEVDQLTATLDTTGSRLYLAVPAALGVLQVETDALAVDQYG